MKRLAVLVTILAAAATARAEWSSLTGKPAPELGAADWVRPADATTLAGFRGRPVLVVFLAPSEPASLDALPHLVELDAIHGGDGLVVLGVSVEDDADLEALAEKKRILFPLAAAGGVADGWGKGDCPRAFLVDPDGEVVWEGDPAAALDEQIDKLARKTKRFLLPDVDEAAEAAADAFRKGDLAEAETLAGGAEGDGAALVKARVAAIREAWLRDAAAARKAGDYVRAIAALELLEKHFEGTPAAEKAAAEAKELSSDKAARADVSAFKAYERLYTDRVRAGDKDRRLKALVKKLDRFLERHEGTRCAAYAMRMKDEIEGDPAINAIRAFIAKERVDTSKDHWRTRLHAPPKPEFSTKKTYYWNLDTNRGSIRIRFLPAVAPMHVASTIYLTELGFYDGLTFHRVITGFMAQGGCPLGTGMGNPGYKYDGEFSPDVKHDRPGILSMANSGPGTDGSQFFITFGPRSNLDGKYTIFGEVVAGMDTVKRLEEAGSADGKPKERLEIRKATVSVE